MAILQASVDPHAQRVYRQFAERQMAAFEGYLPEVAPERRVDIVGVMSAVLDVNLREWALGRQGVDEVYRFIDVAAELLLPS
jgi:hypothetical protein